MTRPATITGLFISLHAVTAALHHHGARLSHEKRAKYEQFQGDDEPDQKFVTVSFVRQIYVYLNDLSTAKCLSSQTRAVLKPGDFLNNFLSAPSGQWGKSVSDSCSGARQVCPVFDGRFIY